ncbi:hypothetical protein AB0L40_27065 [Patulibacter sp. NPDC049589]|uniref:hypothetical protein n=1 Tax=Patulibacter sp. NPDC049589 TaxID=3154731 RepID=UPI0034408D4D
MANRPRWSTLNLAALSAATAASRIPRMADLVPAAAGRDRLLGRVVGRDPSGAAEGRLLERAVVLERISGSGWDEIAPLLGAGGAHATELRWAGAERAFRSAEAFPVRRDPGGRPRRPDPEVLDDPDARARTLDGLTPSWAPRPSALLTIDDATWLAHEHEALALMRTTVERGDLADGVDPVEARLSYERRRLATLSWRLAQDDAGEDAGDLVRAVAEATAECVLLASSLARGRRVERDEPSALPADDASPVEVGTPAAAETDRAGSGG